MYTFNVTDGIYALHATNYLLSFLLSNIAGNNRVIFSGDRSLSVLDIFAMPTVMAEKLMKLHYVAHRLQPRLNPRGAIQ
jgi:hypothetical protein